MTQASQPGRTKTPVKDEIITATNKVTPEIQRTQPSSDETPKNPLELSHNQALSKILQICVFIHLSQQTALRLLLVQHIRMTILISKHYDINQTLIL